MPLGDLQSLERSILTGLSAGVGQQMCFVEICCSGKSALREACGEDAICCNGVSANVQDRRVVGEIQ